MVNHINDIIQTLFARQLVQSCLQSALKRLGVNLILSMIGLLVSGAVRMKSCCSPDNHATTAGAGDVPVSVLEDVAATTISVLSVVIPILVAIILVVFLIGLIWWIANQSIEKTT